MHRDEVARAEQRLRIEQLEAKAAEDFGLDVEPLVAEYGPDAARAADPVGVGDGRDGTACRCPSRCRYERAVQEKRAAKAERELALLGKVNPLALEEFAALEERYKFLSEQLEDLKATRRDLLTVVKDVDERILEVFASAFDDTAREFEQVFTVLFPGGEGRLILTDPDDLLTTGVEVEARPPGKKIKRLSLLSGGERSLTAVAMLVAIFRARPSPFYIMDEVEAALDDVNLGRLITLLAQLREKSQLIVITHQKRTMEIADALYGVTMRSGRHPGDQPTAQPGRRGRPAARPRRGERVVARERATALLLDFDGVLRRWDPAVAAGVEREYGLAEGVLGEIAMQWGRLQPVLTGQVSHAEWMTSVADALTESVGGPDRARAAVEQWQRYRGEVDAEVLASSARCGRRASGSGWAPTPPTCSTPTSPRSAWSASWTWWSTPRSSGCTSRRRSTSRPPARPWTPRRPGCSSSTTRTGRSGVPGSAGLSAYRWGGHADLRYLRAALDY